jgi:enterochelin esterase-like enzyme
MEYGFFPEATPRNPTQAEIDGVIDQTSRFYEQILKARFPNLMSFRAVFIPPSAFTPGNRLPVLLNFDANAFFTEGKLASKLGNIVHSFTSGLHF